MSANRPAHVKPVGARSRHRSKIDKIAIACYRKDLPLLRTCVASIRYWYPEVEIRLIKDLRTGWFPTRELEKWFGVSDAETPLAISGWGWTKIGIFLLPERERYLVLDADTVFLGRVLDRLEEYDEDFIVTGIEDPDPQAPLVTRDYFDDELVREFDPGFRYPGFAFNTGQMVVTSGVLTKRDFEEVMRFDPAPQNRFPSALRYTDQGILNYVLGRARQRGRATVRYTDFWKWPASPGSADCDVESLGRREGIPYVMHWAGIKPTRYSEYHRRDLLQFYEDWYYSQIRGGRFIRPLRAAGRLNLTMARLVRQRAYRMIGRNPWGSAE